MLFALRINILAKGYRLVKLVLCFRACSGLKSRKEKRTIPAGCCLISNSNGDKSYAELKSRKLCLMLNTSQTRYKYSSFDHY